MFRGLAFVVCALSAGCLRDPKFNGPRDGDPEGAGEPDAYVTPPEVNAFMQGQAASILGPHFRLVFSGAGSHLPDSMQIGNTELLGEAPNCNGERRMGIALFPPLKINYEDQMGAAPQPLPEITTGIDGPYVAQVRVPFSHSITCNTPPDPAVAIAGVSTFTAFPDGRITHYDQINIGGTLSSTDCPVCPSGTLGSGNFFFTTYSVLRADTGNSVTGFNVESLVTPMEVTLPAANRSFCVSYMDTQTTIAYPMQDLGNRIRAVGESPRSLVFVHDFVRGATSLSPGTTEVSTTMLLGQAGSSCSEAQARALTLVDRPQIEFGPPFNGLDLGGVGLNGLIGNSSNGPLDRAPGPIQFKPRNGPLPGGFAIWLELGTQLPIEQVTVSHSNKALETNNWYLRQIVSNSQVIFYFPNQLPTSDSITITPPPAQ